MNKINKSEITLLSHRKTTEQYGKKIKSQVTEGKTLIIYKRTIPRVLKSNNRNMKTEYLRNIEWTTLNQEFDFQINCHLREKAKQRHFNHKRLRV